jgi:hypothetical protein
VMWQEPCRLSPPLSRRRTRRREAPVLPVRPQCRRPCNCTDPRRTVVPGTSRCPRGAANTRRSNSIRPKTKEVNFQIPYLGKSQVRGTVYPSALGQSRLRIRPLKMFFAWVISFALETLHCATRVGPDCPHYSKARWARSWRGWMR